MRTVRSSRTSAQTPLNYAYRLLAQRDYSEARLVEKLHSKGFSSQATTATVEALRERGHVNDTRLAVGLTEWFQNQGFGPRAIWVKLKQKGLTEGAIEEALSGHVEQTDVSIAQRLVQQRFSSSALQDSKMRARAFRLLLRRGYSPSVVASVLGRDRQDDYEQKE